MGSKLKIVVTGVLALCLLVAGCRWVAPPYLRQWAGRYVQVTIPSLIGKHAVDDYVSQVGVSEVPARRSQLAADFNRDLGNLALLGNNQSFDTPVVTVQFMPDFATDFGIGATFQQNATYASGPVTFAGHLALGLSGWRLASLVTTPQGPAADTITKALDEAERIRRQPPPPPDDGLDGIEAFAEHFDDLLKHRQSAELDQLFTHAISNDDRMKDGDSVLHVLDRSMSGWFSVAPWTESYQQVTDWRKLSPRSSGAAIMEAEYWIAYGWDARGSGFSNTITSEGGKLFHERLLKAQAVLQSSKDYASANPLWYGASLQVAMGLSDTEGMQDIFDEGQRRFPGSDQLYMDEAQLMQPRWFGSYGKEDHMIRDAAAATSATEGMGLYARLYWYLDSMEDTDFDLFHDSPAQWPLMRQGFEDLVQRHPQSNWLLNRYAAYACVAGDGATVSSLLALLGDKADPRAWRGNHSLDLCRQQYARGSEAPVDHKAGRTAL